jgi:hypothetical protein
MIRSRRTAARPRWRTGLCAAGLALGSSLAAAQGDATGALGDDASRDAVEAAGSWTIPALEIVGFDFLLNRYNHRFSGTTDYDVSGGSIRRNLRSPWVVDNDPFPTNQFAHPYQGSLYHGAGRSAGLGYWQAAALTFAGSAGWEIAGERTPPSRNDQIASGIAGSFLGEPLFRMAHLLLNGSGDVPRWWRQTGAALVSPALGLNRLLYGSRFDAAFDDHDPVYNGRLRIVASGATHDTVGIPQDIKRSEAQLDFALDYGLPGKPGYSYRRPFDHFSLRAVLSNANGVETLITRGLLAGTDYAVGAAVRGVWGLYGNYDYLAPQFFNLSTTGLSLGTTAQWWASRHVALQGSGLVGLGYAAASTGNRGNVDERAFRYGMAPRAGAGLRAIVGERAALEVSGQRYLLGRIANRAAGRDDIQRLDAAFTWRVTGRHAVGVRYAWSQRRTDFPQSGEVLRRLGTVGLYYALLGLDGFGAVEWRGAE